MSMAPGIIVSETSNFTQVYEYTMHLHINNMENILRICHVAAIFVLCHTCVNIACNVCVRNCKFYKIKHLYFLYAHPRYGKYL